MWVPCVYQYDKKHSGYVYIWLKYFNLIETYHDFIFCRVARVEQTETPQAMSQRMYLKICQMLLMRDKTFVFRGWRYFTPVKVRFWLKKNQRLHFLQ